MKRSLFLLIAVVGVVMGLTTASALAASPSSGTVGPAGTSVTWNGASFLAGATLAPDACPPSIDSGNVLCDHFTLSVAVTSGYWDTHSGGVKVTINWPDSSDNFDLYVYTPGGSRVGASAATGGTGESVFVPNASGSYEVRVVPTLVSSSGYSGRATFTSQAVSSPSPTGTSGSGSSGSGTTATTGTSGSKSGGGSSSTGAGGTATGSGTGGFSFPGVSGGSFSFGPDQPGGLYFGNSGGGTTYFGPGQNTVATRSVVYESAYGGPVSSSGLPVEVARQTQAVPLASAVSGAPKSVWLLLPIGLLLLVAVTYLMLEPEEEEPGRAAAMAVRSAKLPVSPFALGGLFIQSVWALGRGGARLVRWARRRTHG